MVTLTERSILRGVRDDPFVKLYREDVLGYYRAFLKRDAVAIDEFVHGAFPRRSLKYVVTTGIGADEAFSHFPARIYNETRDARPAWLILDSPRQLRRLPTDATTGNTLFMEFSRSGKTEETVKLHEYTPRQAKRVVFANSGPLRELGLRDGNLVLELPDQVSGRFGRNKTPILLAPMHVLEMDTQTYWEAIAEAVDRFDPAKAESLPLQMGKFLFVHQRIAQRNHIYVGCNDEALALSRDELVQFWNEGVNKNENDISMSGYFGLPRDSHANIEGLLANRRTKMAIFVLKGDCAPGSLPAMTARQIDPINPEHRGLEFGQEEVVLAEANFERFADAMPTMRIRTWGLLSLAHSAILGQLWADLTYCYSRFANVDPGSNPEVKLVRDRSARLLAECAGGRESW